MPYLQQGRAGSPQAAATAGRLKLTRADARDDVTSVLPVKEYDERPPVALPYVEYPLRAVPPTPLRLTDVHGTLSADGVIALSRSQYRSNEEERRRVKRGWASKLGAYQPLGKPDLVLERKPQEEVPKPTIVEPRPPSSKAPQSGIRYKLISFERPTLGRVEQCEYAFYSAHLRIFGPWLSSMQPKRCRKVLAWHHG